MVRMGGGERVAGIGDLVVAGTGVRRGWHQESPTGACGTVKKVHRRKLRRLLAEHHRIWNGEVVGKGYGGLLHKGTSCLSLSGGTIE
jgi:hypothetical protein